MILTVKVHLFHHTPMKRKKFLDFHHRKEIQKIFSARFSTLNSFLGKANLRFKCWDGIRKRKIQSKSNDCRFHCHGTHLTSTTNSSWFKNKKVRTSGDQ